MVILGVGETSSNAVTAGRGYEGHSRSRNWAIGSLFWYTFRMQEVCNVNEEQGLHHQLTAGQMAMVAVGGSIGTGLLLGSASAIGLAGPARSEEHTSELQ